MSRIIFIRMSRHKCTKELYKAFLQASSVRYSGLALSELSPTELSHDSISRWLSDKNFRPSNVWSTAQHYVDKTTPCLLIADDIVLSKQHSSKIELVNYQYSGNAHDIIVGIGLVNMLWYELESEQIVPINYRIYDKDTDGKTKNTHFCEMRSLAKQRGIVPESIVMDTWYSSLKNLKAVRDHEWIWVTTLRKNRKVNRNENLGDLEIPDGGLRVHLRGYGWGTGFKFVAKNGRIDYVNTKMEEPSLAKVKAIFDARWSIETYHRELKQTCGIERCQARTGRSQRNHICMSILAWLDKHKRRVTEKISLYRQDWNIIKNGVAMDIRQILATC